MVYLPKKYCYTTYSLASKCTENKYIYIYAHTHTHTFTGHFIRYILLVPGRTPFVFRTVLILRDTDSTRCWKHSSEILVHIVMIASRSCCRFVVCTSMMRISRSTTSQRCSIGLRSGDCGGYLSKVNCFHVLYAKFWLYIWMQQKSRLIRSGNVFQSSIVQFWWSCVNCILRVLFLSDRSGTGVVFCCWIYIYIHTVFIFLF